jgi:ParB-like chromosome segregation protein Spo0J
MPVSQIHQVAIGKLRPHPANVHTHSKKQIAQIARAIEQFGFISPIVVNENKQILAGHGRWLAAKMRGLRSIPIVTVAPCPSAMT